MNNKLKFVTCPKCGCETIVEKWRENHRCDCCRQYFTMLFI